jgi:hypothetical protein
MIWLGLVLIVAGVLLHALVADAALKQLGRVLAILGAVLLIAAVLWLLLAGADVRPPAIVRG